MLGAALHMGQGVPRDRYAGFVWLLRAHAGGRDAGHDHAQRQEECLNQRDAQHALGDAVDCVPGEIDHLAAAPR